MGFQVRPGIAVPAAEEVYRYALRLDEYPRSLTDRFGLSILFVNDTSLICREFLQKYCVDLCLRTADRIRFVFFSELSERDIKHIASGSFRGEIGLLPRILQRLKINDAVTKAV